MCIYIYMNHMDICESVCGLTKAPQKTMVVFILLTLLG